MSENSDSRILYIDYSKCIGCETCEGVCRFLHNQPRIVMVRTVGGELIPLYCRNCPSPMCVKACAPGALSVDACGRVNLNPMLCRGCQSMDCVQACPFGGIHATGEGVGVSKCTLCAERAKLDMPPACMEMCPCGAIQYVERNEIPELQSDISRAAQKRMLAHVNPKQS